MNSNNTIFTGQCQIERYLIPKKLKLTSLTWRDYGVGSHSCHKQKHRKPQIKKSLDREQIGLMYVFTSSVRSSHGVLCVDLVLCVPN